MKIEKVEVHLELIERSEWLSSQFDSRPSSYVEGSDPSKVDRTIMQRFYSSQIMCEISYLS